MVEYRQTSRRSLDLPRRLTIGLLPLSNLERTEVAVRILDIHAGGMGVESDHCLEPGLVWLPSSMEGHRGGMLVWSRKRDGVYRAGIRFLPFTDEDEQFLQHWPPCAGPLRPCRELEDFIAAWVGADRGRSGGCIR